MIAFNLPDANDALIETTLDDRGFHLGLSWNEAGGLWTMSVRDLNRQFLIAGVAVVPLWPLLRQVRRPELPPGDFVVAAASGTVLDRQSFVSGAATLLYFDADDIAQLAAT